MGVRGEEEEGRERGVKEDQGEKGVVFFIFRFVSLLFYVLSTRALHHFQTRKPPLSLVLLFESHEGGGSSRRTFSTRLSLSFSPSSDRANTNLREHQNHIPLSLLVKFLKKLPKGLLLPPPPSPPANPSTSPVKLTALPFGESKARSEALAFMRTD